ncbi:hypothetical protein BDP27DRAFT_1406449 [Rhodocollybia butyracea]|uniref:Uncharacterized protein n=1 Tax=Rhodocollybia butyracea TaxID=206335 RepID=A0A9P5PAE1_9AGAR|nr:hypothetical protein BDP27DRAFT_1406449 [Rhodocollybia butyracea]
MAAMSVGAKDKIKRLWEKSVMGCLSCEGESRSAFESQAERMSNALVFISEVYAVALRFTGESLKIYIARFQKDEGPPRESTLQTFPNLRYLAKRYYNTNDEQHSSSDPDEVLSLFDELVCRSFAKQLIANMLKKLDPGDNDAPILVAELENEADINPDNTLRAVSFCSDIFFGLLPPLLKLSGDLWASIIFSEYMYKQREYTSIQERSVR